MSVINVDCYAYDFLEQLTIETAKETVNFVFSPSLKKGRSFHLGLFFDDKVRAHDVGRYPHARRIAALMESPISVCYENVDTLPSRFSLIFTHQEELSKERSFSSLLYGANWIAVRTVPDAADLIRRKIDKTGLVSFIGSVEHPDEGAYRLRRDVSSWLLRQEGVDCYGKGIRPVSRKVEAIEPYRFSVAMENAAQNHYFTEKLVDCILLETVPVYYGCPGITDLLDGDGLIQFSDLAELERILPLLTPERYEQMRPALLRNRETLIRKGWFSTPSLFVRLAEEIVQRSAANSWSEKSTRYAPFSAGRSWVALRAKGSVAVHRVTRAMKRRLGR